MTKTTDKKTPDETTVKTFTVDQLKAMILEVEASAAKEAEETRLKVVPDVVDRLATIGALRGEMVKAEADLRPLLVTLQESKGTPADVRAALALHFKVASDDGTLAPLMVAAIANAPDGWGKKVKVAGEKSAEPRPWHYVASLVSSLAGKTHDVTATGGNVYTKAKDAAEAMGLPQQGGREDIPQELKTRIEGWVSSSPLK